MSETSTDSRVQTDYLTPMMWTVVFVNDDFTPMEFVIQLVISVFNKSADEANVIMLAVHNDGKASIGSYTKEVACNKADTVLVLAYANQHPLQVYPTPLYEL